MNFRDLQYLVAVADYQHFGKAADACFVSQPALSMQLKKLESMLGVKLIERNNKHVMLTEVGLDIVERARKILRDADAIKAVAKSSLDPFSGQFKLGVFPTLAPYFLPKIVPEITKNFSELQLLLIEEKTDELLMKLRSGDLDAALIALPIHDDRLEFIKLFDDPFLLAVPKEHPLAKRKRIRSDDIEPERLLLLDDGHCLRDQALSICSHVNVSEYQDFRATSLETLRQMVSSGIGVTLIPEIAKKTNDGLAYIQFVKPVPHRTIGLVWRKTSPRKIVCHKLAELMQEVV